VTLRRLVIAAVVLVIAVPVLLISAQVGYEHYMMARAGRIGAKLESYRSSHGEYPIALSQLGINSERESIYYQRDYETPLVYYLWFGTGFGTVAQYDSKSHSWHGPP
jgi:type II secretory pathway pseudopilin PulG